jgi:hypothetical protein
MLQARSARPAMRATKAHPPCAFNPWSGLLDLDHPQPCKATELQPEEQANA